MWWMKKFRKRKIQSLLIFIVVAMCTTLITGSAVILTSLTSVYENLAAETNAADVKVYARPTAGDKDYKSALEAIDCVKSVDAIQTISVTTLTCNGTQNTAFIDVCAYQPKVYGQIRMLSGKLDALGKGSCLLPQATAVDIGAEIGDGITVKLDGTEYTYTLAGTFAEIYSAATQYTCDMLVTSLPKDIEHKNVYAVKLADGADAQELIAGYTKDNDGILDGYFRIKTDTIMNAELTELILGGILLGISSVVFLAILLILSYIVKNSFAADKKTIAIYKTIGYTNRQIRGIYITFYMSMILSATVIGGLLSPLLSNSFIKSVYRNIGGTGGTKGLPQILICILVVNLISFLLLFGQTRRIGKLRPVDILNGNEDELGKKKQHRPGRMQYHFSPWAMALRMMRRERKNTILLIITSIISLYIVNLSVVCLENMDLIKGETNYYWLGIDKHDVTIENNGSTERFYDICKELSEDTDVAQVVRSNFDIGFAIPYHQTTSALVYETFDGVDTPVLEGRNPKYPGEVVVGNIYLKELGIEIGDYITVQLDATHREDLLVVGTYQGFFNMGRGMKVLGGLLEQDNVEFDYRQCSINLKSGVDKEQFMERMEETYQDDVKVIDGKNLYASIMAVICDPQKAALLPFVIITICIGSLNVFYIIYASNSAKQKKYTIYKSLGYTSGHLLYMNGIYVGLIALLSMLIAIPAFIILFPKLMVLTMSSFGFAEYKLVIKPLTLIVTNALMLLVFLFAAFMAAIQICQNHVAKIMNE